jgi:proteasome lid subunit RPN8/RPN11
MSSVISKKLQRQMQEESIARYPQEACGLIVKKGRAQTLVPCKNVSDDPEYRFVIAPEDFAAAEDVGEVMAVWHSHTDEPSAPSETDIYACNSLGLTWFIGSVSKKDDGFEFGEIRTLTPTGDELDLVGRPYIYGVYDCYTLMLDYYKKEMGIEIERGGAHYPERTQWHTEGLNLLVDGYKEKGFTRVTDADYRVGDVLIIQFSSGVSNHVAIYIGDDKILHHCAGRLSCVDVYGGSYWHKHTTHHLRYIGDRQC